MKDNLFNPQVPVQDFQDPAPQKKQSTPEQPASSDDALFDAALAGASELQPPVSEEDEALFDQALRGAQLVPQEPNILEKAGKKAVNLGSALGSGLMNRLPEGLLWGTLEQGAALADKYVGQPLDEGLRQIGSQGDNNPFDDLREFAKKGRHANKAVADAVMEEATKDAGMIERNIYSGAHSVGLNIAGLALTAITKNPQYALASLGLASGGIASGEGLDKGLSPEAALKYGTIEGGSEILTEYIPVAKLIGDLESGSGLIKTLMHQMVTEVPTELVATTVQSFNEWATLNPDTPFRDYLATLPSQYADTVISTMAANGMQTGILYTLDKAVNKNQPNQQDLSADPTALQTMIQEEKEPEEQEVQAPVLPDRDDLAEAINNDTELDTEKTVNVTVPVIDTSLQDLGYVAGSHIEQVTKDGEVFEGTLVATNLDEKGGVEATIIDQNGVTKTLFSEDGEITATPIAQPEQDNIAPDAAEQDNVAEFTPEPPSFEDAETAVPIDELPPAMPPAEGEQYGLLDDAPPVGESAQPKTPTPSSYDQMNLEQLTKALGAVKARAKQSGWTGRLTKVKAKIEGLLKEKYPEYSVPEQLDLMSAAEDVNTEPTDAQKEAGNYKKGHVSIQGLNITIENPQGSQRTGKEKSGEQWSVDMPAHYGYIKRTEGADSEQVDVYVGDSLSSENVFIVDQIDPETEKFDEHKVLIGYDSPQQAMDVYTAAFSDGKGMDRAGALQQLSMADFKKWLKSSNNKKPFYFGKKLDGKVKIENTSINDSYRDELFATKTLRVGGLAVAAADINILGNDLFIQYITTRAGQKRRGYAKMLVDDLFREHPNKVIRIGMTTDSGAEFFENSYDIVDGDRILPKGTANAQDDTQADTSDTAEQDSVPQQDDALDTVTDAPAQDQQESDDAKRTSVDEADAAQEGGQTDTADAAQEDDNAGLTEVELQNPIEKFLEIHQEIESKHRRGEELKPDVIRPYLDKIKRLVAETKKAPEQTYKHEDVIRVGEKLIEIGSREPEQKPSLPDSKVGNDYFKKSALEAAQNDSNNSKSRETLIQMKPNDFLKVALEMKHADNSKVDRVKTMLDNRQQFTDIPFLQFAHDGKGNAKVTGHEGRHRAKALMDMGVETIPVRLISAEYGNDGGQSIRWGEQSDPDSFDVIDGVWPTQLKQEDGETVIPFPVNDPRQPKPDTQPNQGDDTAATDTKKDTSADKSDKSKKSEKKDKMKDVGEKLEGGRKFKGKLDSAKPNEQAKMIIEGTKPSVLFTYNAPAGQTSGVARFHQELVKDIKPFSSRLTGGGPLYKARGGRYGTKFPSWSDQVSMVFNFKEEDGDLTIGYVLLYADDVFSKKAQILEEAEQYVEMATRIQEAFENAKNLDELRIELGELVQDEDFNKALSRFSGSYWLDRDMLKTDEWSKYGRIKDDSEEKAKKGPAKKLIRPKLDTIERENLKDYRGGKDISSEKFAETFGFRGVEFGNWVNAAEGQAHVNHAYDSLMDLATKLKIRPKDISIGGKLGFAFGSRGSGEHAAHFEPDTNVINLTKTKGDGSVAHEWSHALDHNLSQTREGKQYVASAYNFLSKAPLSAEKIENKVKMFLKGDIYYEGNKRAGVMGNARKYLRLLKRRSDYYGKKNTKFQNDGNDLGKKYWGSNVELFARAWEAWVYDTIDGKSPYLVNPWVADGAVTKEAGYRGTMYPIGDERKTFNDMFERFMQGIEFTDDGVSVKEGAQKVNDSENDKIFKTVEDLEPRLGQMLKEIEDGNVQQDEIRTGVSDGDGRTGTDFVPPDDTGTDTQATSERDSGTSGPDVPATDESIDPQTGLPEETGRSDSDRDSVQPDDTVPQDVSDQTEPFQAQGTNHVISLGDLSESRSTKEKARDNIKIIKLVKQIETENRAATPEEQVMLAKFTGWGSIKNAFPDGKGQFKPEWAQIGNELKTLLTDKEYKESRRSIQFAHYTSEIVVRSMWGAVKKFGLKKGTVFEAGMGIGNFIGMKPTDLNVQYSGLEIDPMSARIARILYPESGVREGDFISAQYADGMFEAAIGNPPFSDTKIKNDPKYKGLSLHNYFFAKTIDMIADGGVVAYVTSRYSMDTLDASARELMAEKVDLIGAIRLPNTAFKTNANTEVVADIIFLRKRLAGEERNGIKWINTKHIDLENGSGGNHQINEYFVNNPEMVLGNFANTGSMYSANELTVEPVAAKDLQQQLDEAIGRLPENIITEINKTSEGEIDFSPPQDKDGSYYIKDNVLMQIENGIGQPAPLRGKGQGGLTQNEVKKIKALIPVRDALQGALKAMTAKDNAAMKKEQAKLEKAHNAFVKKHGPITKSDIQSRPPTASQIESARDELRNDYIAMGDEFNEGDIDLSDLIGKKNPETGKKYNMTQIAKIRQEHIEKIEQEGGIVDHGDFDPADVPDNVSVKYPNLDAFKNDPDYYTLMILENYDAETDTATKTDVFTKNIVKQVVKADIKTAVDALNYSLYSQNKVDPDLMAQELGKNKNEIIAELKELDLIYELPTEDGGDIYVYAEEYLSGEVKQKLAYAEAIAKDNEKYKRNVNALEAVQPKDIPPSDINTQLGAPYFSEEVIKDFMSEVLEVPARVYYSAVINNWDVSAYDKYAAQNTQRYGTKNRNADDLMAALLSNKEIKVTKTITQDGKDKTVVNVEETQAAQDKAKEIQQKFDDWVWKSKHGEMVHRRYNDEYNNVVPRKHDGKHITAASTIPLREHQKNVIWRVLQTGNTYMAHAVGAGKTLAMVGAAMEARRIGMWRKPMFVVPNHMLAQFAGEFKAAYPQANIYVADENSFHTSKRKRFVANVAKGDWDAVIMTYSSFKKVPISKQFEADMIERQLDEYRFALEEANRQKSGGRGSSASRLEKQIQKMEQRMMSLKSKDVDQSFSFEQLGVDAILLDEGHYFRKLSFSTLQGTVKGVNPIGSQASWGLYMKGKYLDTVHPKRNLVIASGTPLTNTLAEVFTIQRYMDERSLKRRSIANFDAWASVYANSVTSAERQPSGAYKNVTRLAEFKNLNSLSQQVRQFMDTVTSDELGALVDRPTMKTGAMIIRTTPPTREYKAYQKYLEHRTNAIAGKRSNEKGSDNILTIINDGRHAAIDMRLIDPTLPEKRSKLEDMIENVYEIYKRTSNDQFKIAYDKDEKAPLRGGAQLIFSDLGIKGRTKNGQTFSAYDHIRRKLVQLGVPKEEIAFIADYDTTEEKRSLQNKVRNGEIRVLIGSTSKMGTGLNVQNRLKAVHNLDAPWLPADLEQRTGRALRQGNQYGEVEIYGYGTEGSYDSTMWGMLEIKSKAITQFLKGDKDLTTMRDIKETDSFRIAKAMTSGDERVIKHAELESEVEKLSRQAKNFTNEQMSIKSGISSHKNKIEDSKQKIKDIDAALKIKKDLPDDKFLMEVNGSAIVERSEAGEALDAAIGGIMSQNTSTPSDGVKIASYRGFDINMFAIVTNTGSEYEIFINDPAFSGALHRWDSKGSASGSGIITRANNALNRMAGAKEEAQTQIERSEREIKTLQSQINDSFPQEAELNKKRDELIALEKDLKENTPVEVVYDDYPIEYWAKNKDDLNNASFYILGDNEFTYSDGGKIENKAASKLAKKINKRLLQVFPQARFTMYETPDQLPNLTGLDENVQGFYWRGVIAVSMKAQDILGTINHEVIHGLKSFGAFTNKEWSILENKAAQWRAKYDIDRIYRPVLEQQGLDESQIERKLNEEGIAHAFQDRSNQGMVRRIANRAVKFIKTIRDVLKGRPYNFTTADQIFDAIESGEIGAREMQSPQPAQQADSAMFSFKLPKAKKAALDDATNFLGTVRGLEASTTKDIGRIKAFILHPHQIATLYKPFTRVYLAVINRFQMREKLVSEFETYLHAYNKLPQESKDKVNAFLEIERLDGKRHGQAMKGAAVAKNVSHKDAVHSKVGEMIALNIHEENAYRGVRKMLDTAFDKYIESVYEDYGLLEKGVNTIEGIEELRLKAIETGDVREARRFSEIIKTINEVEAARRKGYIPFKRWGQIGISVKDGDGKVIHFERVEVKKYKAGEGHRIGNYDEVQDAKQRLMKKYSDDPNIDINVFEMNRFEQVMAHMDLRDFDVLAANAGIKKDERQRIIEAIEYEQRKRGFRSHFFQSRNISGYSGDFERALNEYSVSISGYISRRMHERKIEFAVSAIAEQGRPNLHNYAQLYVDYTNQSDEEFAAVRTMVFFWYLAGNISSGLVNLTQPIVVSAPWFSGMFSWPTIGKEMTGAYDVARKTFTFKNGLHAFDFAKAPADVRDALIKAEREGDFISFVTNDAMAISNQSNPNLRGLDKKKRQIMDAVALTFSVPEKINRIATFVAAYKMALNPSSKDAIMKFIQNDQLVREMIDGNNTQEAFAFTFAEYAVMSTQYRVGKLNRPTMARGFGSAVFQFWSYMLQTFELMYKLQKVHGGKNGRALASMLFMIFMFSGLKGLPFEDDLQSLLEAIYKEFTKKDLDIDTGAREILTEHFGRRGAEMIMKGAPAAFMGVDLSGRVGMGNIVPDTGNDFMGVWFDMVQKPFEAVNYVTEEKYYNAAASLMPLFIKNPMTAYTWAEDGVRTRYGKKVIDSSDVTTADAALKAFGFQSSRIARKRDGVWAERRANNAVNDLRNHYYGKIAKTIVERNNLFEQGRADEARQVQARLDQIFAEIRHHNDTSPIHKRVILNKSAIKRRIGEELGGADNMRVRKQARPRQQEIREIYDW